MQQRSFPLCSARPRSSWVWCVGVSRVVSGFAVVGVSVVGSFHYVRSVDPESYPFVDHFSLSTF